MHIMTETLIKFECPATCIVAGASGTGKSTCLFEMFKDSNTMFTQVPKKIIYCYSTYQTLYDEMKKKVDNIEFLKVFLVKKTWTCGLSKMDSKF